MRHGWWRVLPLIGAAALAGVACVPVTVNINFSQEKLDSAAGRIEDAVGGGTETPTPAPAARPKPSSALPWAVAWLAPREASAQEPKGGPTPTLKRTPELTKAIEDRRARRRPLREWKNRGCVGETNDALLVSRPGDGCGGEVALVAAENADRLLIYNTFMQQNNIPAADASRVRAAFTKARRERARPNDWIQQDDGQWVRQP